MKKLNLVFNTSGKAMTVSLTDPKEGLTLEECRTAAEKLQVVLSPSSGETVTGFLKVQRFPAATLNPEPINLPYGIACNYLKKEERKPSL